MLPHQPDVTLLRWPDDTAARQRLAAARRPRLLLLAPGQAPPTAADELEDWIRYPLDADELAMRTATLAERARAVDPRPPAPELDADGRLQAGDGRWVAVAPLEARLLGLLLERPGQVVRRDELAAAGWPDGLPAGERVLDGAVKRLRRRVAPLGVRIHAVTAKGYLLDHEIRPAGSTGGG